MTSQKAFDRELLFVWAPLAVIGTIALLWACIP